MVKVVVVVVVGVGVVVVVVVDGAGVSVGTLDVPDVGSAGAGAAPVVAVADAAVAGVVPCRARLCLVLSSGVRSTTLESERTSWCSLPRMFRRRSTSHSSTGPT